MKGQTYPWDDETHFYPWDLRRREIVSKKTKVDYSWNEEIGLSICFITVRDQVYMGMAQCHPDDMDMVSEKTGNNIAYHRAVIDMLRAERDRLKIEAKALKEYYFALDHSPRFNRKSFEAKTLYRQIQMKDDDLANINDLIKATYHYIDQYINGKDEFYQKVRKQREARSEES